MIEFISGAGLTALIAAGILLDYRAHKNRQIRFLDTEVTIQRAEKESYKRVSPFATTNAYWRVDQGDRQLSILDRVPMGKN